LLFGRVFSNYLEQRFQGFVPNLQLLSQLINRVGPAKKVFDRYRTPYGQGAGRNDPKRTFDQCVRRLMKLPISHQETRYESERCAETGKRSGAHPHSHREPNASHTQDASYRIIVGYTNNADYGGHCSG
jgi:hypothetical protein